MFFSDQVTKSYHMEDDSGPFSPDNNEEFWCGDYLINCLIDINIMFVN